MGLSTRRALFGALAAAPLLAADFWDTKPYEGWEQDEIRRILTNSPWAQSTSIPLRLNQSELAEQWKDTPPPATRRNPPGTGPGYGVGSPVGGIGAPMPKFPGHADVTVMWASAAPVRKAIALSKKGGASELTGEDKSRLAEQESDYVVEVYGIPAIVAHAGAGVLQSQIYQTAYLRTGSGRALRAHSVYVPIQGDKIVVSMRFSREEPLTPADKWVECGAETPLFSFARRFNLRQMDVDGKLEL